MKSRKKVVVQLRSNSEASPGGDANLMLKLGDMLSKNYIVEYLYGSVTNFDNIHCIICCNLDRPVEAYFTLKAAQKRNVPVILYALHHPYDGIKKYLKSIRFLSLKGLISRLSLYDCNRYEDILALIKSSLNFLKGNGWKYKTTRYCQLYLLEHCENILVVNEYERKKIEDDVCKLEELSKYVSFPHPINLEKGFYEYTSFKGDYVLVAGRIETRKNQLSILNVAKINPTIRFKFCGALSLSERSYGRKFLQDLSALDNCEYVGELDIQEFNDLLKNSRYLLTGSYFEVTSLIELYALSYGVPVIRVYGSYLSEFYLPISDEKAKSNWDNDRILSDFIVRNYKFEYPTLSELTNKINLLVESKL